MTNNKKNAKAIVVGLLAAGALLAASKVPAGIRYVKGKQAETRARIQDQIDYERSVNEAKEIERKKILEENKLIEESAKRIEEAARKEAENLQALWAKGIYGDEDDCSSEIETHKTKAGTYFTQKER